jgi:hypothetical protein
MVVARADFQRVYVPDWAKGYPDTKGSVDRLIYGTITEQDAKALQELSPELERRELSVDLDSRGGNVSAAMQIGRLIRKYEGTTRIAAGAEEGKWAKCHSACALIFIAGVRREIYPGAQLGLHRPHLTSIPQGRQVVEKQVPLILSQLKQYVAEMGITDNFYQQMVNTEPSQLVTYGHDSYTKLFPEVDPVYEEIEISYEARARGVTTDEMRQRHLDGGKGCYEYIYSCAALLWGLSARVYRDRDEKAKACYVDGDDKLLDAMPKKERRDHPLWIKRETCIRNIMMGLP